MTERRKSLIRALLKGIETGEESSVAVVNPDRYVQHNPQTYEGGEGLAVLFKRLSKTNPRVNIVRLFSDGDFVFGHTEYDFSSRRVGFEIFRFEGDMTVEHWDNIQPRMGPNRSGHSMVDGETRVTDFANTETNRAIVRTFVSRVLIDRQVENLPDFVDAATYTEHSPMLADGLPVLKEALNRQSTNDTYLIQYEYMHRVLAEGNFVLSVCEGHKDGEHTSFFDLFRLSFGKIVEHWDTTEKVPPRSEWKNDNGKF